MFIIYNLILETILRSSEIKGETFLSPPYQKIDFFFFHLFVISTKLPEYVFTVLRKHKNYSCVKLDKAGNESFDKRES